MTSQVASALETPALELPPSHGATVAFIYGHLREDIIRRRLCPGARLIEKELSQRFDVSRGPIREALRRLAAEGLIEHVPNRGGTVRRLSRTEMHEFFEIRIELETLGARLAAQNSDAIARAAFRAAIKSIFDDAPREISTYLAENAAFHEAILTLAGSHALRELIERLNLTLLMRQVRERLSEDVLKASVREHRAIANAILDREPDVAAAALRGHLERAAALALSGVPAVHGADF